MSATEDDFERLMQRVRDGCQEASRELFDRYNTDIQRLVRHRLSKLLRAQFDSLDFTQDAWASFFHVPPEQFTFKTPEELVAFLARIARNKLVDVYRQRKHTLLRIRSERQRQDAPESNTAEEPAGRQPTPSQFAIAEEQWDRLLRDQPPEVRRALELLRNGHSHQEVADCLGVNERTVRRVLQHLREKLNKP